MRKLMRAALEQRGRRTVEILGHSATIRAPMPEGGMFVFADVRATGLTGEAFALGLLAEENVAVMPGESFGAAGAGPCPHQPDGAPRRARAGGHPRMVSFAARHAKQD
jgi:aspartate/methionine/tyrosine aminotransferase